MINQHLVDDNLSYFDHREQKSKKLSYSFNLQALSLQELHVLQHVLQDNKTNKRLFLHLEDKHFFI